MPVPSVNDPLPTNTAGIILCGGQSSRMGKPKAWLEIGGATLLERITRTLAESVDPIVVVAAERQPLPEFDGSENLIVVRDRVADEGPLRGIAEGLDALPSAVEAAFVSSVDVPLLHTGWAPLLVDRLGDAEIAVPVAAGRVHPLAAVYRRSIAATAHRLLGAQRRRPVFLFDHHQTVRVTEEDLRRVDPDLDSLRNANTPEDFAELVARWERRSSS